MLEASSHIFIYIICIGNRHIALCVAVYVFARLFAKHTRRLREACEAVEKLVQRELEHANDLYFGHTLAHRAPSKQFEAKTIPMYDVKMIRTCGLTLTASNN